MMHFSVVSQDTTYLVHDGKTRVIGANPVEGSWELCFQSLN